MSSGVLRMGPTPIRQPSPPRRRGGEIGAKQMAIAESSNYCTGLGREILVTNTSSKQASNVGAGSVDITFQCLARGDPGIRRPVYEKPPTAVIQDQRQR